MDRNLSKSYLRRRKTQRWIIGVSLLTAFIGIFLFIPSFMEPTVELDQYRVGKVTRGGIITSTSTEGKVEPVYQEVITTPVTTRVLAIRCQPGDTVNDDSGIIELDMRDLLRRYRKVQNEVALKENSAARKKEELRKRRNALKADLKADSLRTERLKAQYENERQLLQMGGTSRQSLEQARIDYRLNKLEQEKLQRNYQAFKRMIRLDLKALDIELSMKRQKLRQMRELLDQARIRPSRKGVVTRISVTPGESVSQGQEVARVASQAAFQVKGAIPDQYVDRVYSGQPVQVLIDDTTLAGSLSSLTPGVDHGEIAYTVKLHHANYVGLKAKKKVEIRLIENQIDDTLRIPNASYYLGAGTTTLFVIRGRELVRRKVRLGSCSYDYVLVKAGLKQGERVILSRSLYKSYSDHQRLKWKN